MGSIAFESHDAPDLMYSLRKDLNTWPLLIYQSSDLGNIRAFRRPLAVEDDIGTRCSQHTFAVESVAVDGAKFAELLQ